MTPVTLAILIGLFLFQSRGTAGVGTVFGPVTLVWFFTIAMLGLSGILRHPAVLGALLPHPGLAMILVTQDEAPVLVAVGEGPATALVHDARSGALLGEISEAGMAATMLFAP